MNVLHFQDLWGKLNITNDDFIRTTEPRHEKRVQHLVSELIERDEIYLGKYEGWYDEGQEEYVTETEARDNEYRSAINDKPLVKYSEENWFFRLTKWVPALIEHIEANPGFVKPEARRNEVLSKLRLVTDDLCISRNKEKLPWGVEMPNDPDHVVYVWIDALSNYYNACGLPEVGDEYDARAAGYWPADVHLIGKDILWFHAVYWPCMLMALDIPLPRTVFAHGWWTSEGKKMSKSLGNFISREVIEQICEEYSRDVFRYYLLRAVSFGSDGDFSRAMLHQTYNSELANGIGNLLSRTVNMIGRYFDGEIPEPAAEVEQAGDVRAAIEALESGAGALMDDCAFHKYIENIMQLVNTTNRFIDSTEPFKLAKDESRTDELATILGTCAAAVKAVLTALRPIMPEKAEKGLMMMENCGEKGEALFPRKQDD
jgi:methionyl-tRNA synthetase